MKVTDVREVPLEQWRPTVLGLRDEGFEFFDWLSAVDQTDAPTDAGFDLMCHLIDVARAPKGQELRSVLLRARVAVSAPVPSLTPVFRGSAWHERETHEMFGIDFEGFDDGSGQGLRPLLLPDGFEGTPLRKSFMLAARASKPWPGAKEPGEGHESARSPGRRRVQAPGVPGPDWGPR